MTYSYPIDGVEYLWGTFSYPTSTQTPHWYVREDQKHKDLSGEITIRDRIDEQGLGPFVGDVLTIAEFAFRDCNQITAVHLPSTIKLIQGGAFIGCTALRTITMDGNVEAIAVPFQYCKSLSIFYCGTNPEFIGNIAYDGDMKSFHVYLTNNYKGTDFGGVPEGNVKKNSGCGLFMPYQQDTVKFEFDGSVLVVSGSGQVNSGFDPALKNICPSCEGAGGRDAIEKIDFQGSVTVIGQDTFANLVNLQEVVPGPVTDLYAGCFAGCTKLKNVNFRHAKFTTISDHSFKGCTALDNINLPTTLRSIGNGAFRESGLISVAFLGSSMTSIGTSAFESCTNLETFNWPSEVTSVGEAVFKGCTSFGKGGYTVPDSIVSIGVEAFSGTGITSLDVSDTSKLSQIGRGAFFDCKSLTSVRLHAGVANIDGDGFKWCNSLSSVHVRGTDTGLGLGQNVFYGCKAGLTIIYCRSAQATGSGVFGGTENTIYVHRGYQGSDFAGASISRVGSETEIFVPVTEGGLTYSFDGSKLTITGTGQATRASIERATTGQCGACSETLENVQELFLESGVGLSDELFYGCNNLGNVTYCGITAPGASSLFDSDQVQVHVPSIYEGDTFGGKSVTKSTDVDSICEVETPTSVESFVTSDFDTATLAPIDPTSMTEDSQTPTDEEITATSDIDDGQGSVNATLRTGLIVGLVLGLLLLILLVLLLIWLFVIRRRKERSQNTEHELTEETVDTTTTEPAYGTDLNGTETNPLFAQEFDNDLDFRQAYEEYQ